MRLMRLFPVSIQSAAFLVSHILVQLIDPADFARCVFMFAIKCCAPGDMGVRCITKLSQAQFSSLVPLICCLDSVASRIGQ